MITSSLVIELIQDEPLLGSLCNKDKRFWSQQVWLHTFSSLKRAILQVKILDPKVSIIERFHCV